MKASKRTEDAVRTKINKSHITLEGGLWGVYSSAPWHRSGRRNQAIKFCEKRNKEMVMASKSKGE